MIINHHPDTDGINQNLKFIGYWSGGKKNTDGRVRRVYDKVIEKITHSLPNPNTYIDNSWDISERDKVIAYLKQGKTYQCWLGKSHCRFGCKREIKRVGDLYSPELDLGCKDLTDGTYVWPEGFWHYLEVHMVRPPKEFVEHCLRVNV